MRTAAPKVWQYSAAKCSECREGGVLRPVARIRGRLYDEHVPNPSGTDKFRAFSRVIGRQAGQSRWTRATYHGARTFFGSVGHVIRALWHEVTGVFFFVFGAILAFTAVREYRQYSAGQYGAGRPILAAVLALMFLYFALSAFRRAGQKK